MKYDYYGDICIESKLYNHMQGRDTILQFSSRLRNNCHSSCELIKLISGDTAQRRVSTINRCYPREMCVLWSKWKLDGCY